MKVKYQPPTHNKPEDYGLTQIDAWKIRLRYLREILKEKETEIHRLYTLIINTDAKDRWCPQMFWEEHTKLRDKYDANIRHIKLLISGQSKHKDYDIERLKEIPIGNIYEILPTGFFVNNPLRNEHSPSNSLHWNRVTNKWNDYGTGEHGDVIDIIQKVNKCSFIKACEILTGYL